MGMYDKLFLLHDDADLGHAASEYSAEYTSVDFGVTTSGVNLGNKFGLHMVVTEAFTGLASGCILWIVHGASTSPTTKHTGMFIPVASLTLGAHFFVPAGNIAMLRHARAYFELVSEVAVLGEATLYFGPGPHGSKVA